MEQLKVFKVHTLPGSFEANAIYYLKDGEYFRTIITDAAAFPVAENVVTMEQLDSKQNASAQLTTIAAINAANNDIIQRKSGAWINRTPAQFKADLALAKADVGLGNVDNTSDVNKPISTATQMAINQTNAAVTDHANNEANPHTTTLEQVRAVNNLVGGNINMNGNRIQNMPDAVTSAEPLTKGQFDALNNIAGRQRGEINCSANPNYPAAKAGDRWEVIAAGKIGGAQGIDVDIYDEIVCKTDNAGGAQAAVGNSFYVVQGNLMRATETVTGYSRIATAAEANAGTDNTTIMTPLQVRQRIEATAVKISGSETIFGVKQFNDSPIIPEAVNNNQPTTRGQVISMMVSVMHEHQNMDVLESLHRGEEANVLGFEGEPVMRWEVVEW